MRALIAFHTSFAVPGTNEKTPLCPSTIRKLTIAFKAPIMRPQVGEMCRVGLPGGVSTSSPCPIRLHTF